jgi:hypothetical protein
MPEIETPGRRVLGTPVPNARKKVSLIFTVDEVAAIVARLPEYWSAPRAQVPYPVRARYIVAWETALRPQTIAKLVAPTDYRPGAATLLLRDEVDKNRFGRELPLTDPARDALDSVCPQLARSSAGTTARCSAATHLGRSSDNLAASTSKFEKLPTHRNHAQ